MLCRENAADTISPCAPCRRHRSAQLSTRLPPVCARAPMQMQAYGSREVCRAFTVCATTTSITRLGHQWKAQQARLRGGGTHTSILAASDIQTRQSGLQEPLLNGGMCNWLPVFRSTAAHNMRRKNPAMSCLFRKGPCCKGPALCSMSNGRLLSGLGQT